MQDIVSTYKIIPKYQFKVLYLIRIGHIINFGRLKRYFKSIPMDIGIGHIIQKWVLWSNSWANYRL